MPAKHGFSHGLATLVCAISGGLLVALFRKMLPSLSALCAWLSDGVSRWLSDLTGLGVPSDIFSTAVMGAALAFVWGAAFAFLHRDTRSRGRRPLDRHERKRQPM